MGNAVVEILKMLLSVQVIAGAIATFFLIRFAPDIKKLMARVATIRFPGGAELSTTQVEKTKAETKSKDRPSPVPPPESVSMAPGVAPTPEQVAELRNQVSAERVNAYLWEYRYLNYYLAPSTQYVLGWLASLQESPTVSLFDNMLGQSIPSPEERMAILSALQQHHLVEGGALLRVTPKGREYLQWRGPFPPPTT